MSHFQVMPECFADTLLVNMLGFTKANHQLGIGKVIAQFEKQLKNRPAVGIIDNDKVKPKALDSFDLAEEKEGIRRLSKGRHSILVIHPALEAWVFDNAAAVEVSPARYGFNTRKDLQAACKKQDAARNQQLKNFLNTLMQKNAPGFVQLRAWICECAGIEEEDI